MRVSVPVLAVLLLTSSLQARGLVIPKDKTIPPLAMLRHEVTVAIEDQAATTRVEQTYKNHTGQKLEASYVFPVPKGGSVHQFSMLLGDKEVKGAMVAAGDARAIYSEAVSRSQDPGLLEYLGNDLFQLKVFPVPAGGQIKVALSFTTALPREAGVVEYHYPLDKASRTLEKFSLDITVKLQHGVQSIYSPTHAITVSRQSDRAAKVVFQKQQALLDKDFQLLIAQGQKDVGLTLLPHRPAGTGKGHFMMLLSPRAELPKEHIQPRDLVLVLDVSGSMAGTSIAQAKKALKFVLDRLGPKDRFGLISFSDTVNKYGPGLWESTPDNITRAKGWVDELDAVGGTNLNDALLTALELRPKDSGRTFTVIFFTDGQPTVGEIVPEKILKNVLAKNTANTRIFTFGVGHDVNATLLDQLAQSTRASSVYVRPTENIETRVSSLFSKIHQPVLVDLKLSTGSAVVLEEMFPPRLPDLFHGGQVMVLGKYSGHGRIKVKLEGTLGKDQRTYEYEVDFPEKTGSDRDMVEIIWARRKIGFLLDLIRARGENKELVGSVMSLAKKYGIATPYTSYLIVPESPLPVVDFGQPREKPAPAPKGSKGPVLQGNGFGGGGSYGGLRGGAGFRNPFPPKNSGPPINNTGGGILGGNFGGGMGMGGMGSGAGGGLGGGGGMMGGGMMGMMGGGNAGNAGRIGGGFINPLQGTQAGGSKNLPGQSKSTLSVADWARLVAKTGSLNDSRGKLQMDQKSTETKATFDQAKAALAQGKHELTQAGQLGFDLSVQSNQLRDQTHLSPTAQRRVAGRTMIEIGGAWIDQGFDAKMPTVVVKAFSPAYFRLLKEQPRLKELFQLGNHLVWVGPSGSALVIDLTTGQEKWEDATMTRLFKEKGP